MRVAVTILYNGLHHLKHNDFAEFMVKNFDYWAVVDGLSGNGGSTSWCNGLNLPANSTDGSVEFMTELASNHNNVLFSYRTAPYKSKDHQVNEAVELLRRKVKRGWLWQVDVDEQWTEEKLYNAEQRLFFSPMREASFQFNHYVGKNLIAKGDWGNGYVARLFKWRGQRFRSHEPASIDPHGRVMKMDGIKFDHYSYYFDQDVKFKDQYYGGYKGIYDKWVALQQMTNFPQPLSVLMPSTARDCNSNTQIIKI